MARRILLGSFVLTIVSTLGCGGDAQTAGTSPAPSPPSSITTTPPMPGTEGATTTPDPASTPQPMPGTEGMPTETVAAPVDGMPAPYPPTNTEGTSPEGSVAQPNYSVVSTPDGMPTEGMPTEGAEPPSGPLGMIGNLLSGFGVKVPGAETPMPGMEGVPNGYSPDGVATAPPEKPFEKMTLRERSESSFRKGEETDGFRWLYAHAIADDLNKADETLDQIRWMPGPKRPSLASRFGVAVKYEAGTFAGAPPVIGDSVPGLLESKRGADGQPSSENLAVPAAGSDRPKEVPTTAPATLRFFAGDLALNFLEKFEANREKEGWGVALAEMGAEAAAPETTNLNPYGMPGGESYATPAPVAESGEAGESAEGARGAGPSLPLTGGDQISPGIVWLGFDTSAASAARKAAPLGIDCVLLVDVKIQVGRNAPPRNKTKVTALDVASGKPVASPKMLDHFDVYEMRALRPNAPDPVKGAVDELYEALATNYSLQPMPEISSEAALNRGRQLIADLPEDPLPALAEMRYYLKQGLIDEAQYAIVCKNLAGDPAVGEGLASKKAKDRKAAVEKLIASKKSQDEADEDAKDAEKPKPDSEGPGPAAPAAAIGP